MTNKSIATYPVVESSYKELIKLVNLVSDDIYQINFETTHSQSLPNINHLSILRDRIKTNNDKCKYHMKIIFSSPRLMYDIASKLGIPFINNILEEINRSLDLTDTYISSLDSTLEELKKAPV